MYPKPGKGHTHGGPSRSNYSILTRLGTHLSATRPTRNLILANPRPLCCYLLAINWYLNVASRWLPEHVVQCHNITRRHLSRLAGFTRKRAEIRIVWRLQIQYVNMLVAVWFTVSQTDLIAAESSGSSLVSGRCVCATWTTSAYNVSCCITLPTRVFFLRQCTTLFQIVSTNVAYRNRIIIHIYIIHSTSRLATPRCFQFGREGLLFQRRAVQFCYNRLRVHLCIL